MHNVKLTGRGPESRKTKPHYNRAPVERHVSTHCSQTNLDFFIATQSIGQTRASIAKRPSSPLVNTAMAGQCSPKKNTAINNKNGAKSHGELLIVELT